MPNFQKIEKIEMYYGQFNEAMAKLLLNASQDDHTTINLLANIRVCVDAIMDLND